MRLPRDGYTRFTVAGRQAYRAGDHTVETDGSNAGYFWAAAAVGGNRVKVGGVNAASRQGDIGLAEILGRMGCTVTHDTDGIAVAGGPASGHRRGYGDICPMWCPTLAVVAAFAPRHHHHWQRRPPESQGVRPAFGGEQ